jgi:lysophospholipase L1-like esterase
MVWFADMKTSSVRHVLPPAAICLCLHLALGSARAVQLGQDSSGTVAEIEHVYSIIRQESGFFPHEAAPLPVIKRDRQGKIWAAWEKWGTARSRIELASFGSAGIESDRIIGPSEGCEVSPDFAISPDGKPWVIWVNALEDETQVLVLDVSSKVTWRLTAESSASVTSPKILFDAEGSPWAFWNVTFGQSGEIVYRVMHRGKWTAPAFVPRETKWPALNPDAVVNGRGTIWLIWSGYDGQDYEIYLTHWTGTGWAREAAITDNAEADLFPSLGLNPGGELLVGWTRSSDSGRRICLAPCQDGMIGLELELSTGSGLPTQTRIIRGDVAPAVVWKSGDGFRIEEFPQSFAPRRAGLFSTSPPPRLLDSSMFDENRYACVGDSITFGYVDWYPYPERGYIPRLDAILNKEYGSQRVINEGLGGEVTADGLARLDKVFIADLARYILIMEGTNDIIFDDISIPSAAFNLQEMVRKCLAAGAFPTIATIIPRRDWYGTQPLYHARLLSLNDNIRQIAADLSVPLVDMYAAFDGYPVSDGGLLSLLSIDLKHPSDKGYEFMAKTWFSGIQNFPFPPVNASLEKQGPERKIPNRAKFAVSPSTSRPALVDPQEPLGNLLTWSHNPKIYDSSQIQGYRIYRKKAAAAGGSYLFLAFVTDPLQFFDQGAAVLNQYSYVISALRKDGIEGPCSASIGR